MPLDAALSRAMGIFLLNSQFFHSQKPYSTLKPGQRFLKREYYKSSTRNTADGSGYTENYKRYGSIYFEKHCKNVVPEQYLNAKTATNFLCKIIKNYTKNSGL